MDAFDPDDLEVANAISDAFYQDVKFRGLSGMIDFNEEGYSPLDVIIEQQQGQCTSHVPVDSLPCIDGAGKERAVVGFYLEETKSVEWVNNGPKWFSESGTVCK